MLFCNRFQTIFANLWIFNLRFSLMIYLAFILQLMFLLGPGKTDLRARVAWMEMPSISLKKSGRHRRVVS